MVEEAPVSPFPSHQEITIPNNDVIINFNDVKKSLDSIGRSDRIVDENVNTINESEKKETSSKHNTTFHSDTEHECYKSDKPDGQKDSQKPSSIYTVGGSNKRPKLELKDKEVSTRQCKFEICEEWEQFQIIHDKSVSCPPSPLIGRKHDVFENGGRKSSGYAASEPGEEIDFTNSSDKTKDPFPFHFLFTSSSASPIKECHIVPNPFNKVNQRFHSTLQCPCFLFFFFLCCLPAVHFMQQSDRQFKKGNNKRARNYGMLSTSFYIFGTVLGIAFLIVAIYFAADYVKQFV